MSYHTDPYAIVSFTPWTLKPWTLKHTFPRVPERLKDGGEAARQGRILLRQPVQSPRGHSILSILHLCKGLLCWTLLREQKQQRTPSLLGGVPQDISQNSRKSDRRVIVHKWRIRGLVNGEG